MEWLAQAMGWTTRCRDRPFRDLYETRPTPRQSITLPRDRNGSFFRPASRGGRGDLASFTPGSSQLGADLPISCVLLCPHGAVSEARETVTRLRSLTTEVVPTATHWRNPEHREFF